MKTIDIILKEAGYTKEYLLECRASGLTNGMGRKWWIPWTKKARKFKAFDSKKWKQLLDDLDLVSDIHDLEFWEWGWFIKFFKSNMNLINRVLILLHWTSILRRLLVFTIMFFGLNTVWIIAFNWGWKKKSLQK